MALVMTDAKKSAILTWIFGHALTVHLDVSGTIPDGSTPITSFTEPTDPGYMPKVATGWSITMNNHVAEGRADRLTWSFDTDVWITGYYVEAGGELWWSENIAAGGSLHVPAGEDFDLTPRLDDGDCE